MAIAEEPGIDIRNVGPIEHLHIPMIEGGGCVILAGRNGSGKSHALEAISRLGGNKKVTPPIRDGAKKGEVDGCGVHIVVGGKISSVGELEVESIEGKFDLSKLVDPGIAAAESANAARIKQLLTILELPVDESCFYDLAGGKEAFEALAIRPSDDVVELAGRVKRAMEEKARKLEGEAERLSGQVATRMADINEYGDDVERDAAKLNAAVEAAIAAKAKVDEQRKNFEAQSWRRQEAQRKLAELPESREAELLAKANELEAVRSEKESAVEAIEEKIVALKVELQTAISLRSHAIVEHDAAVSAWQAEHDRANDRTAFEAIIATDLLPGPTDEEIAEAATDLEAARQSQELGTLARQADAKANEAKALKRLENENRTNANRLREAAKSTDAVLSDLVAQLGVALVVHEGQLSVQTERGYEPFAELSHGERWKLAIELGQKRVGAGGLLPIPQEAWESLDPANRQVIADAARQHRVQVITAEAASGELRAESYEANGAG